MTWLSSRVARFSSIIFSSGECGSGSATQTGPCLSSSTLKPASDVCRMTPLATGS